MTTASTSLEAIDVRTEALRADVSRAQGRQAAAEAALVTARDAVATAEVDLAVGSAPEAELEARRATLAAAQDELRAAVTDVATSTRILEGVVARRDDVESGELVDEQESLARVWAVLSADAVRITGELRSVGRTLLELADQDL